MEIGKTANNGITVLTLSGRLDTVTAPQLQTVLQDALQASGGVELDFADLAYVSSTGLRVLLLGEKNAKASGKTITLKNVSPEIMEVLDITGLSDIFKTV